MAFKPLKLPEWATAALAQITEPLDSKKLQGWISEIPPHETFNWIQNLSYQWLDFFKEYSEIHIHDGSSGEYSAPKVHLKDHVDYGVNGDFEVVQDDLTVHEVRHTATGTALFSTDRLRAATHDVGNVSKGLELTQSSGLSGVCSLDVSAIGGDEAGVLTNGFRPTMANAPGGNFSLIFPENATLYLKNLTKAVCLTRIDETSEVVTQTDEESYNCGALVTSGADAYKFSVTETGGVVGSVTASVGRTSLDTSGKQYLCEAAYDGSGDVLVRIYSYNASTSLWENVRTFPPDDMNILISVEVK